MSLTWKQLSVDTHLRNVAVQEVEDQLSVLESMSKRDISVTCFQFAYRSIEGFILEIKELHSNFRKKAAENKLLADENFKADAIALVKWQMESWNRLDKLKPKAVPDQSQTLTYQAQGNIMHDALYNLDQTLQKHNDERNTNVNLTKPHFKGGKDCYLKFEAYCKDFKTWTRNIKDKVRLLQLLRDTLSGSALNQIVEMDLVNENYDVAWQRLINIYKKPDECKGLIIDKIFGFQFNMSMDKLDEAFNNYCLLIDKLLTSHKIDLLHEEAGVDDVLAHLTFKRLPQTVKNVLLTLCATHYPTFDELKKFIPIAVDRINKTNSEGADSVNCGAVTNNFKGAKSKDSKFDDSKKKMYCIFCDKDNHYSSDCFKFPNIHDRINRLKEAKRCSFCGRKGHYFKDKCGKLSCGHCHKSGHMAILCIEKVKSLSCNENLTELELADFSKVKKHSATSATTTISETILFNNVNNTNTALPFAVVQVIVRNFLADCKVLFDQGSQVTLISNKFVNHFQLKSNGSKEMRICGVTGEGVSKKHKTYPISIQTNDGVVNINAIAYDTLPTIQMPGYNKVINNLKKECNNLAKYPLNSDVVGIELLLGCDYYYQLVENSSHKVFDTLTLMPTKVGRVACGPYCIIGKQDQIGKYNSNFVYNNIDNACEVYTRSLLDLKSSDEINKNLVLSRIFTMENLATNQEMQSIDEKLAYDTFEKEIYFDNDTQQYCVPLLFKGGFPPTDLPTNYNLAIKRHNQMKFQLDQQKNHQTRQDLATLCLKERELRFIEPVPKDKLDVTVGHFIPAVLVKKQSETTPLRRCFDCSAKMKNKNSLNDLLFAGPNLVPKIFDIIIRSRFTRYFLLCDISKAFLRCLLIEKYREYVKIILREDWTDPKSREIFYRFKTVLFGSTCSPFLLQATISHHLKKIGMEFFLDNLFVDDISFFSNKIEELLTLQNSAVKAFNQISMPLAKYVSNNDVVTKDLVTRGLIEKPQTDCKLLGMHINLSTDCFILNLPNFNTTDPTLTTVLSDHASVWDVIGLIEPVRVASKIFINSLFKDKLSWKDKLNEIQKQNWSKIVDLYKLNADGNFSRMCTVNPEGQHTLHVFTDASSIGFGGVAFVSTVEKSPSSSFLCSKSKLKGSTVKSTIPKLELSGILYGLDLIDRLVTISGNKFKFKSLHLWSDAKVALSWICSDIPHSIQYISSRTKKAKILIEKHGIKLHYIESQLNSADLLTKGFDKIYHELPLWMSGPPCIREKEFPVFKEIEFKEETGNPDQSIYVNAVIRDTDILARVKNVSSFDSLLKITHILQNAGKIILSHKLKDNPNSNPKLPKVIALKNGPRLKMPEITPDKVNCLFYAWIEHFQSVYFSNYLDFFSKRRKDLGQGCQCCPPSKALQDTGEAVHILNGYTNFGNLHIVIDSVNILRVKTRSSNSFDFNYRFPILLPKDAHFSSLYALEMHKLEGHVGPSQTLSACRNKVWIVSGRGVVNRVVRNCWLCKLHTPKLYRTPHFPNLPETRMSFEKPFQNCGIDMSGHYTLYNKGVPYKRYVLIITCLSSRAVHALVCRDNSAYSFIHCFRRHIFRYGAPQTILTDNAKNFQSLNSILEKHSKNNIVKQILRVRGIQWRFTPNYSPWAGAVFESLVKIVKKILRKTFNARKMNIEDMVTLVYHAEFVANNRPISYVTQNDQCNILTPNLLIFGRPLHQENWLDSSTFNDPDYTLVSQQVLGGAFKKLRASMSEIEKDFNSLYLDLLKERDAKQLESKNNRKRNIVMRTPKVGDVVLLSDEKGRPTQVSRIVDVSKKDGSEIRSCKVILKNSAKWWPVSKISFFEVGSPDTIPNKFNFTKELPEKDIVFSRKRLNRLAKQNINYTE